MKESLTEIETQAEEGKTMGEDQEVVAEAKVEAERTTMAEEAVLGTARDFHLTENTWLLTYRPGVKQLSGTSSKLEHKKESLFQKPKQVKLVRAKMRKEVYK